MVSEDLEIRVMMPFHYSIGGNLLGEIPIAKWAVLGTSSGLTALFGIFSFWQNPLETADHIVTLLTAAFAVIGLAVTATVKVVILYLKLKHRMDKLEEDNER